jgi:hypothetical protein
MRLGCVVLILAFHVSQFTNVRAQSPSVTAPSVDIPHTLSYQGTLADKYGKLLDSSNIPMVVSLYSDDQGTNRIWQGTYTPAISKGLFCIQLGSGNYPLPKGDAMGHGLWLGIAVGGSSELRPLTPVSASAYALNVADNSITAPKMGTDYVSSVQINGQQVTSRGGAANFLPGEGISMSYDSNAQGIMINTRQIQNPIANVYGSNWWGELGNSSLPNYPSPLTFLGITDWTNQNAAGNTQLEIHIDDVAGNPGFDGNGRVMSYEEGLESPNLIGGYRGNITSGLTRGGAVIGGGGWNANVNTVNGDYGFIGGGYGNIAGYVSVVGGGSDNSANGTNNVVAGGEHNTITAPSSSIDVTISGGTYNIVPVGVAPNYSSGVTIGGGSSNYATGLLATVSGGSNNLIGYINDNGNEEWTTIGGGGANRIYNTSSGGLISVNYSTIAGGGFNQIQSSEGAVIAGGENNTISSKLSAIVGGNYNTISSSVTKPGFIGGGSGNTLSGVAGVLAGGDANTVSGNDASIGGGTGCSATAEASTVSGGANNKATATGATIPGGENLTAQSYSQTVIGYNNLAKGSSNSPYNNGGAVNNQDDPVLIVGNGASTGAVFPSFAVHNAFEVTNDGHTLVFDTLGAVYTSSFPYSVSTANTGTTLPSSSHEAPKLGGTYIDNITYAWGDIPAGGGTGPVNPVIPNNSFGVHDINYNATTNTYLVRLELNDQNLPPNGIALNRGSVTATIEGIDDNSDPGCVTIAVSPISNNVFAVWTHRVNLGAGTCDAVPFAFSFKVCGRP